MKLTGRRIHLVGSADTEANPAKLEYVHSLVAELTRALLREGATFAVPFGKEPLLKDRTDGPSIIFDWTVVLTVLEELKAGRANAVGPNGHLIETYSISKTDTHIPSNRRQAYDELRATGAVSLSVLPPGWSAGALRRQRLAQLGDILIGVSGGQGVEQLALEYSSKGKPVIPLDIDVGSSLRDGMGGSSKLFDRALSNPDDFFRVESGHSAANLLDLTRTNGGTKPVNATVAAILSLLKALVPPRVFYVRILNEKLPQFPLVEKFFRETVDVLVKELGYEPLQMGIGENEFAWMNEAIFDSLHHSSVVLVDITGVRPNCFMELGYGLGNKQRVIMTAMESTDFPFDACAIEAFIWKEREDLNERLKRMRTHWERNINVPTLVRPREAK